MNQQTRPTERQITRPTEPKLETYRATFWGLLVLLLVACIAYPYLIYQLCIHYPNANIWQQCSQLGDSFGALSTFISGCAFIAVVISLKQQNQQLSFQRTDLRYQRQEMAKTRNVAKKQAAHFEKQVELGKRAQFYDNFYKRLELLQALSKNVVYDATSTDKDGKKIIREQSGLLAWMHIHETIFDYITETNSRDTYSDHIVTFSAITPWYQTLILLIEDVIEYFKNNGGEQETQKHIKIIINSISECEKDMLIFYFDLFGDDGHLGLKNYLFKTKLLNDPSHIDEDFNFPSKRRNKIIKDIRKLFSL